MADATAFSLCMDNRMPIIVFNLLVEGNIARAVRGERIGTLVSTPDCATTDRGRGAGSSRDRRDALRRRGEDGEGRLGGQGRPRRACAPAGPRPHMFSRIVVDYYGAMTPLNQLASINVPEARMAVIKPYDASQLRALEKAIRDSDLGLNPSNDGRSSGWSSRSCPRSAAGRWSRSPAARARTPGSRSATSAARRWRSCTASSRDGEAGEDEVGARREGAAGHHRPLRPPDRRPGEAQGSRAARSLSR